MRTRLLLGTVGVAMGLFGALRFLQLDLEDILDALIWLVGGVIVHDAVIAPLTIAVTFILTRGVPTSVRRRLTVALVVLVTVTVTAVPVLGRWGARDDNPTLLDRNYLAGWVVFAAVVALVTVLAGPFVRLRRGHRKKPVSQSAG